MQSVKIGELNSEIELPLKSRVNTQGAPTFMTTDSRSINGTLNTSYIACKENWGFSWEVITEANQTIVENIIKLQFTKGHLNMKITNEAGSVKDYTVKVSPMAKGTLIARDKFFTQGYGIEVVEC